MREEKELLQLWRSAPAAPVLPCRPRRPAVRQGSGAPVRQVAQCGSLARSAAPTEPPLAAPARALGRAAACPSSIPLATMASRGELSTKLLKLLLLGNSTVGKTSLMLRFCEDSFTLNFSPTIGVGARTPSALRLL